MRIPNYFYGIASALIILSCGNNQDNVFREDEIVIFSSEADSAMAIIEGADSTYTVTHQNFRGSHMHQGDAGSSAHQDVGRMRRIQKNEAENFNDRQEAYQTETELREERMRRALEEIQAQQDTL